jgi:hypothetical protein
MGCKERAAAVSARIAGSHRQATVDGSHRRHGSRRKRQPGRVGPLNSAARWRARRHGTFAGHQGRHDVRSRLTSTMRSSVGCSSPSAARRTRLSTPFNRFACAAGWSRLHAQDSTLRHGDERSSTVESLTEQHGPQTGLVRRPASGAVSRWFGVESSARGSVSVFVEKEALRR